MPHMLAVKIGDICEIKTPVGLAYVQYTHDGEDMGELVRVLPGAYSVRPSDFAALANQRELYFIFYTLRYALRAKQVEIVSNQPVPEWVKQFPVMRKAGGWSNRERRALNWYIGHGLRLHTVVEMQQALNVRELTPEQRKLSIVQMWPHPVIVRNIARGWLPERDEDFNLAAQKQEEAQRTQERPRANSIDHYLYFSTKPEAEEAAKRLREKRWQVEVRIGGDGNNWLALAKQPVSIEENIGEVRQELEELAKELHGEYDGWVASV